MSTEYIALMNVAARIARQAGGTQDRIGQGRVVVGDGDERHAHLGDVGVRVALDHADREHARALPVLVGDPDQVRHRLVVGALVQNVDQQGRGRQRRRRLDLAPHLAQHQAGAFDRLLARVDMRVGLVDGGDVGVLDHLPGHVGVHVQRHADRNLGAHDLPHAPDQLAVGVGPGLRHCGAVLGQEDGVPGAVVLEELDDAVEDMGDRLGREGGHRRQAREHQRHQLDLGILRRGGVEPGERRLRGRVFLGDRVPFEDAVALELVEAGRDQSQARLL